MPYQAVMLLIAVLSLLAAWLGVPQFRHLFLNDPPAPTSTSAPSGPVAPPNAEGRQGDGGPAPVATTTPRVLAESPASLNAPRASSVAVTSRAVSIRSDPESAEAYFEWKLRGRTPTTLDRREAGGLLVVVKDGYRAAFRRIGVGSESEIEVALQRDVARSPKRVLLVASGDAGGEVVAALRSRLIEEGFSVLDIEDGREFQRESGRAGGLSNAVLRAWARSRYDTDWLLNVRVQQSSRDLSKQEFGLEGVKEAVKGTIRAEVGIDIEITDLRSGDRIAAVSTQGSGFALERGQGFQKATRQAASESARLVKQKIQG